MRADATPTLQRARELFHQGKLREAANLLGQWVAVNKHDAPAWELLAAVHFEAGEWSAAQTAAEHLVRLRPDCAAAHCNLGVILRKQRHFGEALRCQERALQLDPDHRHALAEQLRLEEALASADPTATVAPSPVPAPPLLAPEAEIPMQPCAKCHRAVPVALVAATEGVCEQCLISPPEADPVATLARSWTWVWVAVAALMLVVLSIGAGYLIAQRSHGAMSAPTAVARVQPVLAPAAPAAPTESAPPPPPAGPSAEEGAHPEAPAVPAGEATSVTANTAAEETAARAALAALQPLREAALQGTTPAAYHLLLATARNRLRAIRPPTANPETDFWRAIHAALEEFEQAATVWAWSAEGAAAVDLRSPRGQWALAHYPALRAVATPTAHAGGQTSYTVTIVQVVHAAWAAADAHLRHAHELTTAPAATSPTPPPP